MTTNEFYYNDGVSITMKEAHALSDTSKLVVADKELSKEDCSLALGVSE